MEEHRIKRVPVLEGDRVVGVVSRADLLRALSVGGARAWRGGRADDSDHPRPHPGHAGARAMGAADNAERHRGEWGGRSVGHHRQRPGTPRDLRDRREYAGVKKVIDHLVFVEAYTGTVIEPPPS